MKTKERSDEEVGGSGHRRGVEVVKESEGKEGGEVGEKESQFEIDEVKEETRERLTMFS